MVIDASDRPVSQSDLVGEGLNARRKVIGTPTAKVAFDIVDAVWIQDGPHPRDCRRRGLTSRCSSRTPRASARGWAYAATPRAAPATPRGRDTLERDLGVRC